MLQADRRPHILIIGGGVAGLTAGCYARLHGFDATIFELHHLPGGLCTSWERKAYRFDGCIHYLFGTGEGQPFHAVWDELGVLEEIPIVNHSSLMEIRDEAGNAFTVYVDPAKLSAEMGRLAPEDAAAIDELCEGVDLFTKFDMSAMQAKPKELMSLTDWREFGRKMLPYARPLLKWGRLSAAEFGTRFKNPFLQRAVPEMFGWTDIPMLAGMSLLAYMHTGNAGFPAGGSLPFSQRLEQKFRDLGGTIHYNAQVEQILVKDDAAAGVRLYNDEEFFGDFVISCADGQSTIYELLDGRYTDRQIDKLYSGNMPILSQVQVSFGVDFDFSGHHHWTTYLLDEPLLLADQAYSAIGVKHFDFDPTLAPEGKSSVIVMLRSDYDYWHRIYARKLYDLEQIKLGRAVKAFIDTKMPGFSAAVEVSDVATPMSYERFTGNLQGSTCGWLLTDETMFKMVQGIDKTLPGLDRFYMAGQWVEPGGSVPIVALSGRNVIQLIQHEIEQNETRPT